MKSIYETVSEKDIYIIRDLYKKGNSAKKIKQLYPFISEKSILRIVKDGNVNIRPAKRYTLIEHEDFFENIDSSDKAYILGLLLSDGYVVYSSGERANRTPVWGISLNEKDSYILEYIKKCIGTTKKISVRRHGNAKECYLTISSLKMVKDLEKYGIVPNKSRSAQIANIDNLFLPDLIRSLFDGDGCVTKYGVCSFCGNKTIVSQFRDILISNLSISPNKLSNRNNSKNNDKFMDVFAFYFSSMSDKLKFYKYIYYSETVPCLLRKKNLLYSFVQ